VVATEKAADLFGRGGDARGGVAALGQVFHLDGNLRQAARALERAAQLLKDSADALDGEDRERYLSLPWHVDLRAASATGVWPDPPR
jgi:hypothetical protein